MNIMSYIEAINQVNELKVKYKKYNIDKNIIFLYYN